MHTFKKDEEVVLTIQDIAYGGDGVGRRAGMVVFVPFTLRGEEVRVRITQLQTRWARARLLEVIHPSPDRVDPRCPWFGQCGGCQYQHMMYDEQLRTKTRQVSALLKRIGECDAPPVQPTLPSPEPWAYRTKITLHGPGRPAFIARDNISHIPVEQCPIAHPACNDTLAQWVAKHPDGLRTGQELTIRLDHDERARAVTDRHGPLIKQRVEDTTLLAPLTSFFQVNRGVMAMLVRAVTDRIRASGARYLVDAYAGAGLFGLCAARYVERVYSLEKDPAAVRAARKNVDRLGISSLDIHCGQVEDALETVLAECPAEETFCLLNPPRSGCTPEVVRVINRYRPRHLLVISCAPDKLARDVKRFSAGTGYKLTAIQPYDMFPQTAHIELLAAMEQTAP